MFSKKKSHTHARRNNHTGGDNKKTKSWMKNASDWEAATIRWASERIVCVLLWARSEWVVLCVYACHVCGGQKLLPDNRNKMQNDSEIVLYFDISV